MNAHKFFLSSVAATVSLVLGATGPAIAQSAPSNEELGKRVDSIETKLDALIDMLAKDHSSTPASSTATSPAESSEEQSEIQPSGEYRKGLTLDLYLVPFAEDITTIVPTPPDAFPLASEPVEYPGRFDWDVFTKLDSMKRFAEPMNKRVALRWSGLIDIPSNGQHLFALEVVKTPTGGSISDSCISHLEIDGRAAVQTVQRDGNLEVNQGQLNLEKGLHQFTLWGHCSTVNEPDFSSVHFNLLNKGPNDRAPQPISADRFLTEG